MVETKNFTLLEAPATNQLFISILVSFLGTEKLAKLFDEEREEEKRVLALVDSILRYPNMKRFQEIVEEEFAKFFKAERANLIIVNRHQKEMYRVVYDEEKAEFKMNVFQFDRGVGGYVAYTG